MSKNIIFCFSGTGNSLYVSKVIADTLGKSDILPMLGKPPVLEKSVESIGFVYPIFYQGMPAQVDRFIHKFNIPQNTYVYAVPTYGGIAGNGLRDLHILVENKRGKGLDYGMELLMYSNYINWHDMETSVGKLEKRDNKTSKDLGHIIVNIRAHKRNSIKSRIWILRKYYEMTISNVSFSDKGYNVSEKCTSCGLCERICPVDNISIIDGKPQFLRNCEQCISCIQTCPAKAINYKNKTQSWGRYFHPDIKVEELIELKNKTITLYSKI